MDEKQEIVQESREKYDRARKDEQKASQEYNQRYPEASKRWRAEWNKIGTSEENKMAMKEASKEKKELIDARDGTKKKAQAAHNEYLLASKALEIQQLETKIESAKQSLEKTRQKQNDEITKLSQKYEEAQRAYESKKENVLDKDAKVYKDLRQLGEGQNNLEQSIGHLQQEITEIGKFVQEHPDIVDKEINGRLDQRKRLIEQFRPYVGDVQFEPYQQERRRISPQQIDNEETYNTCKDEVSKSLSIFQEKSKEVAINLGTVAGQLGRFKGIDAKLVRHDELLDKLKSDLSATRIPGVDRRGNWILEIPKSWDQLIQVYQTSLTGTQTDLGIAPVGNLSDDTALNNLKAQLEALEDQYSEQDKKFVRKYIRDLRVLEGQYSSQEKQLLRREMIRQQGIKLIDNLRICINNKNEQKRIENEKESIERDDTRLPTQIIQGLNEVVPIMKEMDTARLTHNQRMEDIKKFLKKKQNDLEIAQSRNEKINVNGLSKEMQNMLNYSLYSIEKNTWKNIWMIVKSSDLSYAQCDRSEGNLYAPTDG